jgi:starch synthase
MSRVLMVASEATPFAKTGGLADVVGALSHTLRARGDDVAVIMPRYANVDPQGLPCVYDDLRVWFGPGSSYRTRVFRAVEHDVPYYLVDCPPLYARDGLYGNSEGDYPDNYLRFAVLSRAVLRLVRHVFRPDVIHCHDWQAALVPVYKRTLFANDPTFLTIPTVLTIHNLGYQGLFPPSTLHEIQLEPAQFTPERLEFFGKLNLLKGGLVYADALTTVSRTYASEIQTPELGFGLDGVLRARSESLTGILNGVDYTRWDPATDPVLTARYSASDLKGKATCKADLLAEFGLPAERIAAPLIGIVSRFAGQKGFDLIEEAAADLMATGVSVVALGAGDAPYEEMFRDLAAAYPGKVAVRIAYDEALAHKIEGGADMFLMPSRYEPCGLNQIYSLRYGTVPVVRATGGLEDTVDARTGFKFREYSSQAMMEAVTAALAVFAKPEKWRAMMRAGMRRDFSWNASAAQYAALYAKVAV